MRLRNTRRAFIMEMELLHNSCPDKTWSFSSTRQTCHSRTTLTILSCDTLERYNNKAKSTDLTKFYNNKLQNNKVLKGKRILSRTRKFFPVIE